MIFETLRHDPEDSYPYPEEPEEKSRLSRFFSSLIWLIIVGFPCLMIVTISNMFDEDVWFVPGGANNFNPIAQYEAVHNHAGDDSRLIGFTARLVRHDGTLDLTADNSPTVTYEFYISRNTNNTDGFNYQLVYVELSRPFEWITAYTRGTDIDTYINLGMDRNQEIETRQSAIVEALPPSCPLEDFWALAIEGYNANIDDFAIVTYDASGYVFLIEGTPIRLNFNEACDLTN